MDQLAAEALVKQHEGWRRIPYLDSRGNLTVGVGFNLESPAAPGICSSLGLDYEALVKTGMPLTDPEVQAIFNRTFADAVADAGEAVPNFDALPDPVQRAIVDMVFNLGLPTFLRFKRFIAALVARNFEAAAGELVNSAWYHQVGSRAVDDVQLVRSAIVPSTLN